MGALSVRAGVIAADTTKEAHSKQKIDLTTVRWEVFEEPWIISSGFGLYIVRIIHLGVANFRNAMEMAQYHRRYGTLVS